MTYWNHRLIEHRNSKYPGHEVYTTVHEVYYGDDGSVYLWNSTEASPTTKEEAEQLVRAFDQPIVAWVDDATKVLDEFGIEEYKVWELIQVQC